MRTLGSKIIDFDPTRGFVAESVSASILYTTVFLWHAPISTTHIATASIMGVGATKRRLVVCWSIADNIVIAWVPTFPAAGLIGFVVMWLIQAIAV